MGRHCSVCAHAQRGEIDAALASGEGVRAVSKRFGISPAAAHRHRTSCITKAVERVQAVAALTSAAGLVATLNDAMGEAQRLLVTAEREAGAASNATAKAQLLGVAVRAVQAKLSVVQTVIGGALGARQIRNEAQPDDGREVLVIRVRNDERDDGDARKNTMPRPRPLPPVEVVQAPEPVNTRPLPQFVNEPEPVKTVPHVERVHTGSLSDRSTLVGVPPTWVLADMSLDGTRRYRIPDDEGGGEATVSPSGEVTL